MDRKIRKEERNEWNDSMLKKIASMRKFPKEVFDEDQFKSIVARFFYFYFTGNVTPQCSIQCTVYSAISLLNVNDDEKGYRRIFEAENYMNIRDSKKSFYNGSHKHEDESFFQFVEKKEPSFRNIITKFLINWDTKNVWNRDQARLMRLAAFLALKLFSVCTKGVKKLVASFSTEDFRLILRNFVDWDVGEKFLLPKLETIKKIAYEIDEDYFRPSMKALFAIIVDQWVYTVRFHPEDEMTRSLLFESLLESTAGNGLGLINLMIAVMYTLEITIDQLLNALEKEKQAFSEHQNSWVNLLDIKSDLLSKESPQYSFPWARLIESKYLIQFSAKRNVFFCGIFAAILESYEGPEVWNADWAKKNAENLFEAKKIGKRIHDYLTSK